MAMTMSRPSEEAVRRIAMDVGGIDRHQQDARKRSAAMSHDHLGTGSELEDTLNHALSLKPGDEFALFYFPDADSGDWWRADIVNHLQSVGLGEIGGTYRGEGKTALQALEHLVENLKADRKRKSYE